jgi:hypothetical protein
MTASFESVSTWTQPMPETTSSSRWHLLESLAREGDMLSSGWLRVAVDGRTGAEKTHTYNNETHTDGRAAPPQRETLVATYRWDGSESC